MPLRARENTTLDVRREDETIKQVEPTVSPAIELARKAATGDAEMVTRLLRDVSPRVTAVVRVVLRGAPADVDDVVQQSLITLVQALPSFRGECEPARFAARIAVRVAVHARRRARVQNDRCAPLETSEQVASGSVQPDDAARASRRMDLIRGLLEKLPDEQSECLALRVVLGWSLEEVASASGAPLNTVRSRIRLAKEALRRAIEADPVLAEELDVAQ